MQQDQDSYVIRKILLITFYITSLPAVAQAATIFVVRRGWHTDVGFEVAEMAPPLKSLAAQFPGATSLLFGFGDRRYLQSKQRGAPVMLAALLPGPGLMLVTGLESTPARAFGADHIMTFELDEANNLAAQHAVWSSLHKAQQESLEHGDSGMTGPYPGSLYFAAAPRYSAAHTCNTWTAEMLAAGGIHIRYQHVLFAGQLWRRLKRLQLEDAKNHAAR